MCSLTSCPNDAAAVGAVFEPGRPEMKTDDDSANYANFFCPFIWNKKKIIIIILGDSTFFSYMFE